MTARASSASTRFASRRLRRALYASSALLAVGTLGAAAAAQTTPAPVGFESGGLSGWTTSGTVTLLGTDHVVFQTGDSFDVAARQSLMAKISPLGSTMTQAQAELALGLQVGTLGAPGAYGTYPTTNYGILTNSFALAAGSYSFGWSYAAQDYDPYNDGVFFSLSGNGLSQANILAANLSAQPGSIIVGSYGSTPWRVFTFNIAAAGTYQLGFGAYNYRDTGYDPLIYIDDGVGALSSGGVVIKNNIVEADTSVADVNGGVVNPVFEGGTIHGTATETVTPALTVQASGGGFNVDTATTLTASGAISNGSSTTGAITKTGAGTLVLTGTNTYTGATNVNAGTLELRNGSAIADTGTVNVGAAGTLAVTDAETIRNLTGTGSTTLAANLTLANASGTYGGSASGAGSIVLAAGTETFSGTLTNTGGVTLNGTAGATIASTGSIASSANAVNVNATSASMTNAGTVTGATRAINVTAGALNLTNQAGGFVVGGGGAINSSSTGAVSITNSGTIATGTMTAGAFTAGGSGNAINLAGAATVDNSGLISGQAGGMLASGSLNLINRSTGVINGRGTTTGNYDGVTVAGVATVLNAGQITGAGYAAIYSSGGGTFTNATGGTLTGASSAALVLDGGGTFNNYGAASNPGGAGVGAGNAAVTINLFAGSTTGSVTTGGGNDVLAIYNGRGTAGTASSQSGVTLQNAGTLAAASFGAVDLGDGSDTLQLRGTGNGTAANGTGGNFDIATSTGAEILTKADSGTWTLTGAAVTPDLTINAGTGTPGGLLIFSGTTGLTGAINVNGATIRATTATAFGTGTITAIDPTIQFAATGTYANSISLASVDPVNDPTNLQTFGTGITATLSGAITQANAGQPLVFSSVDSAGTPNAGTFVLTNTANNWTGVTTISAGTTLRGSAQTISGASITDNGTLVYTAAGTVGQVISGSGNVTIAAGGGNVVTLTGANSWTGVTTVTSGILRGTTQAIAGTSIVDNAAIIYTGAGGIDRPQAISGSGTIEVAGSTGFLGNITTAGTFSVTGNGTYAYIKTGRSGSDATSDGGYGSGVLLAGTNSVLTVENGISLQGGAYIGVRVTGQGDRIANFGSITNVGTGGNDQVGAGVAIYTVGGTNTVTNNSGATISGNNNAINQRGSATTALTVANFGTLVSDRYNAIEDSGSAGALTVNNTGSAATIVGRGTAGQGRAISHGSASALTVVNSGRMIGSTEGIYSNGVANITNSGLIGSGTLSGVTTGTYTAGGTSGITLASGGSIINQSGGTISSAGTGIASTGGGSLTNQSGGTISGSSAAVSVNSAALFTIDLQAGSTTTGQILSNGIGARTVTIAGSLSGAYNASGGTGVDTVTLAATGSMTSANLGGGNDSFLYQGGSFSGLIDGGTGTDGFTSNLAGSASVNLANLTGFESYTHQAGTLTLTGTNAGTAPMSVTGGTLVVDGNFNGATNVANGATLRGTGSVGATSIADGGALTGAQGGTLTMASLGLSSGSIVNATFSAAGGPALFAVTGNLTLDGTLNVASTGAFGLGVYGLFTYGGTLTDNGLALGTMPGDAVRVAVQTSVAGQVNLVNAPNELLFWDGGTAALHDNGAVNGGSGIWSATAPNWTGADGNFNGAMTPQPGFAIFQAAPGTVTVDNGAGAVSVTGMQFAVDGYRVEGGAITLADSATTIRVGDGTAPSAAYSATIASVLTGAGGLVKTDFGTLILTATNDYSGGTTVNAGTLRLGDGVAAAGVAGSVTMAGDSTLDIGQNATVGGGLVSGGTGTHNVLIAGTLTGAYDGSSGSAIDQVTLAATGTMAGANLGAGNDSFLYQGGSFSGLVDGGADNDSFTSALGAGNSGSLSLTNLSNFETYTSASGDLTLTGSRSGGAGWTLTSGTLTLAGSLTNTGVDGNGVQTAGIVMGGANTTVNVSSGATLTASVQNAIQGLFVENLTVNNNGGTIGGNGYAGVRLNRSGTINNNAGGLITSNNPDAMGISNSGAGVVVNNAAGATISGDYAGIENVMGIEASLPGLIVNNSGAITSFGTGYAIRSTEGTITVVNASGGTISGGAAGAILTAGTGAATLDLQAGSTVTGNIVSTGSGTRMVTIAGALNGAYDASGGTGVDTVTLAAAGSMTSANLGGGNDSFLYQGGSFSGLIDGGADTDSFTSNLGPAGTASLSLAGLTNFETYTHQSGILTLTGSRSGGPGWLVTGGEITLSGSLTGVTGAGITLDGGTGVDILAGAALSSSDGSAILASTTVDAVITNAGAITSGAQPAIYALHGATIVNEASGTIIATGRAIQTADRAGIVTNYGTITSGTFAVLLNSGTGDTVDNYGTITGGGTGNAVTLVSGGSVTNHAGGVLNSTDDPTAWGIMVGFGASTVVNAGTINAGAGIVTYVDGTTVDNSGTINGQAQGVWAYGGALALTNSGAISASAGYGVQMGNGGSVTNLSGGNISGSVAAMSLAGAGYTVDLRAGSTTGAIDAGGTTGANVYTIAGTLNGGLLAGAGTDTVTLVGGMTLGAGATLDGGAGTDAFILAGAGDGSLDIGAVGNFESRTKNGAGTWTLTGNDSSTVGWQIDAGTLALSGGGAVNDGAGVTIGAAGRLALVDSEWISTLDGAGQVALGANTLTLLNGGNYAGIIGGTGNVTLRGGTLLLSGANSYTGFTAVDAGTLRLGAAGVLADASNLYVLSGAVLDLQAFDETVNFASLAGTVNGTGTLTAGQYLLNGATVNANLGTGLLANIGGTSVLNGTSGAANVYVSLGTLALGASDRLADTATVNVSSGATLDLAAFNDTVGYAAIDGTLNGTGTLTATQYYLTGATVNANLGAGALFQLGGTSVLNGTAAAADVRVQGGTLALGASNRLLDSAYVGVSAGATLDLGANNETITLLGLAGTLNGTGTLTAMEYDLHGATVNANLGGGTLFQLGGTSVLNGTAGAGTVAIQGGTLALGASNRLNDAATVAVLSGATLALGANSDTVASLSLSGNLDGTGTLTAAQYLLSGGTANANLGAGALYQVGGTSILNGTAGAGTVDIQTGTLRLGASNRLADNAAVTVRSAGVLDLAGFEERVGTAAIAGTLNGTGTLTATEYDLTGATVNANLGAGALYNVSGTSLLNGTAGAATVVVQGGTLRLGASNRLADGADVFVFAGAALDLGAFSDTAHFLSLAGTLNGTGTFTAAEYDLAAATVNANLGAGALYQLSGTSTLNGTAGAGQVNVVAGTLVLGASNRLADTATVAVASGATLNLGANSDTVGLLALGGTLNGTGTLTAAEYQLTGATVNANLGTGALYQLSGTSTLNGTAGAGQVSVMAGTLALGASNRLADTATVAVASGATLNLGANNDTVGLLALGGTLNGTGTLTAAEYQLTGATVNANLGTGALYQLSGTSTLNGTAGASQVSVAGGTLALGASNRLADTATVAVASGATLNLGANSDTVALLALGGTLNGTGTLTAAEYQLTGATVNANLGTGALYNVSGVSTLNGTAGAGQVSVMAGTLALGASNRLADTATVAVASGATLNLGANSDTVALLALGGTLNGTGTLTAAEYQLTGATVNANLGTGALYQLSGTSLLNGSSAAASLGIVGGTLRLGAAERLDNRADIIIDNGGTLDLAGFEETVDTVQGNGSVALGAGRLRVGADNGGSTFAGIISGAGSLEKIGTGLFIFGNTQLYTGGTTVTAGELRLLGSTAGNVNVNAGTFSGSGTISGRLTLAGGTISPGAGTISAFQATNFTSTSGTFAVDVNATQSDFLMVTGAAALNGGLVQTNLLPGSQFQFRQLYTILQAGSLTGTFANPTGFVAASGSNTLFQRLRYDIVANAVVLEIRRMDNFAGAAGSDNQVAVGDALNSTRLGASDSFAGLLNAFSQLSPAQQASALDQMGNEGAGNASLIVGFAADRFASLLSARVDGTDRQLGLGNDPDFGARPSANRQMTALGTAMSLAPDGRSGNAGSGAWMKAYGFSTDLDGTTGVADLRTDGRGVLFGLDTTIGNIVLGGAAGFVDFDGSTAARGTETNGTALEGGVYARVRSGGTFAGVAASYIEADLATNRTIRVAGFGGAARGETEARVLTAEATLGHDIQVTRTAQLGLIGTVRFTDVDQDAYAETGGGAFNLNHDAQSRQYVIGTATARAGNDFALGDELNLNANVRAGIAFADGDLQSALRSTFAGAPAGTGAFSTVGAALPSTWGVLGAGLGLTPDNGRWEASIRYEGRYGSRLSEGQLAVGVALRW